MNDLHWGKVNATRSRCEADSPPAPPARDCRIGFRCAGEEPARPLDADLGLARATASLGASPAARRSPRHGHRPVLEPLDGATVEVERVAEVVHRLEAAGLR